VVTIASNASTTSSQRSATTEPISFHSFSPFRPVNASCPAESRLKPSVAFSTSSTASRPHTSDSERRIAIVSVSAARVQMSAGSATRSGTPTMSKQWSSSGASSSTSSSAAVSHSGWSSRSCSVLVRMNAARCAVVGNT
jgi:hypothetical protein